MAKRLESKFWAKVKIETPEIKWTRIENTASFGTPDALGYNKNNHFFTCETKVSRSKKIAFSPHQISFCVRHPHNHFILIQALAPRLTKLYEGSSIHDLLSLGIDAPNTIACDWDAIRACFNKI